MLWRVGKMALHSIVVRRFKLSLGLCLSIFLSGCQTLEFVSLEPRSYEVNLGSQNVREELILLNIVRASRFEPLNFTALSKYTATGSLSLTGGLSRTLGLNNPGKPPVTETISNGMTLGGSGLAGNSFDLAPLDNQDFYASFLAPLAPDRVHLLVNAGLSREVVFNSIVKAIEINLTPEGRRLVTPANRRRFGTYAKLRYGNDPTSAYWEGRNTTETYGICEKEAKKDRETAEKLTGYGSWAPFYTPFWYDKHLHDCNYQKFKLLLRAAFNYGVTTYAKPKPANSKTGSGTVSVAKKPAKAGNGGSTKSDATVDLNITVTTAGSGGGGTGASGGGPGGSGSSTAPQAEVVLCFDAALAARNNFTVSPKSACGAKEGTGPIQTKLGRFDESMDPVLQSPYGVFKYYGEVLRSNREVYVSPYDLETSQLSLLKITSEGPCFAHVNYGGRSYCVPEEDAGTTKEVLTLLIALVNLSTNRASLPVTPTVLVNP
jgi:hypothetical protein